MSAAQGITRALTGGRPTEDRSASAALAGEAVRGAYVHRLAPLRVAQKIQGGTDHADTVIDRSPLAPRADSLAPP
ncbi:MAG: hypothetical protein HOQ19_04670 [Gemmatimonadaceae bacterium]|nr:hypothetical protein [Gemmatimonadaceae bacterium]NUP70904.1 hypothetical protein [Gemmatimonadaceae bacterium]NUS49047.1 hypothetical protein [Gemmatimonadaceae bacterium]